MVRCWGVAHGVPKGDKTMPRNKDLKRLVRARMTKTGEAYTAARAQLLNKTRTKTPSTAAVISDPPSTSPAERYAALAGMSDAIITEKSGRSWKQWVKTLDADGAEQMKHRDIAALVSRKYEVGPWWTQSVVVGYERIKGLRARGQRRDGTYEANKSRTFSVPVATLFDAWANEKTRKRWLRDARVKVRTATKPKSMRLDWGDGTIIAVGFLAKGASKSAVAVSHPKLPDKETAERLKQYWTEQLDTLNELLSA
jgi:hypothetical protein